VTTQVASSAPVHARCAHVAHQERRLDAVALEVARVRRQAEPGRPWFSIGRRGHQAAVRERSVRHGDTDRSCGQTWSSVERLRFAKRSGEARLLARFVLALTGERRLIPSLGATVLGLAMAWSNAVQAAASAPPPAPAADTYAVRVWYRSSEGCPDGAAFIGLLRQLGRPAALAQVGDRVDFVVTVAYAEGASSGHLERQSSERTVSIRDVSAASCEEVAQVLALSLDLALQPGAQAPSVPSPESNAAERWQQSLGLQLTLETGLARAALPGAALFVDLRPSAQAWSLRLSLRGAYGEPDAAVDLSVGLLASRVEACWAWTVGDVRLAPCGGVELGLVIAESSGDNGRSDVGLWSSAAAHARASWILGRLVSLEAQLGLLVPFVRYEFSAQTGEEVSSSAALGLESALGISFRF
jgi:hypothetical protein